MVTQQNTAQTVPGEEPSPSSQETAQPMNGTDLRHRIATALAAIGRTPCACNIHSTVNFNPADYEVDGYLDNKRPEYFGQPIAAWKAEIEFWKQSIREYFPTCACVTDGNVAQLPEHNIHKCVHCGQTNVRYICAVRHIPPGNYVVFGDVCVAHLGFANFQEFKAAQVRARAAQGNANLRAYRARLAFLDSHPDLKVLLALNPDNRSNWDAILENPVHAQNYFIRDIVAKFNRYGTLSPRQIECLFQSIQRDVDNARRRAEQVTRQAELAAAGVEAPNGRASVEGKVIAVKAHESMYGTQWKFLVELRSGAKVWCSVPSSLMREVQAPADLRGKELRFTATFTQKPEDHTFAFGSRPTGAELIAA